MWEPDSRSINRGVILLVSALSLCFLVYKAWGPLLLITCSLVLVVHACYSLLVNDSLLAPHTLVLLRHAKKIGLEIVQTIKVLATTSYSGLRQFIGYLRRRYKEKRNRRLLLQREALAEEDMNGRQRNVYRLSMDANLADQTSSGNNDRFHSFALNGAYNVARTSTPIPKGADWKKTAQQNGDLSLFTPVTFSQHKKPQILRSENKQPTQPRSEETLYSPKGSPWGNSISPKMSDRAASVTTVQNVAGPLLASTRYNIDPKVYSDVSSPGLTSRLTKYATEASNKLTHQPQYGTGQFPKVNLNSTPTPVLSPKVVRTRMPVTVRVAPPETINYSPSEGHIHPNKAKMFSNTSPLEAKETKSCPSVAQVLKVISLKRHASIEDKMQDIVKKQRVERMEGQLENLEEMMQKRSRDESITSEDDLSPQSKTQRPLKRSKSSSCHDILNSLSSSLSVLSGVKRKAMDSSQCGTPDNEKHFKSSSRSPNRSLSLTSGLHTLEELATSKEQLNIKVPIKNASGEPHKKTAQEKPAEVTKTNEPFLETPKTNLKLPMPKIHKEISAPPKAEKLTDKLFMKAEQRPNEKLKNLIEKQGSIEVKFTTDEKDEIKKQDIVNMRQNSMRLRLQSMFDAISGKSASKIDPDVVIQAEEVNPPASSTYTSLSSLTSTTTVNTSPITTTIVPILKTDIERKSPNKKHVTFNLPSSSSSLSTASSASSFSAGSTTSNVASFTNNKEEVKPAEPKSLASGTSGFGGFGATISSGPSFNFGSNAITSATPSAVSSSLTTVAQSTVSGFGFPVSSFASITSTAATSKSSSSEVKSTTNNIVSSSLFTPKPTAQNANQTISVSSTGFSFGAAVKPTLASATTTSSAPAISFGAPAVAKTTEMSLSNNSTIPTFGSTLSKSPVSTSIAQTNALPNFGSEKKEGGFTFGNTSPTTASSNITSSATTTNQSLFGMSTASPIFSAGSNTTSAIANSTTSKTSPFSFGAANKPASNGFSFDASTAAVTAPSTPTFGSFTAAATTASSIPTFGCSSSTATTASPMPTFGAASQKLGNATSSGNATSTFGSSVTPSVMTAASTGSTPAFGSSTPSLFGAPANSPGLFSGASTSAPTSMFKSPMAITAATTSTSIFGSQSNTPTFGAAAATATTTSTPSLFGNNPSTSISTIPSLFGNTVAAGSAETTATRSAFGSSTTQQQAPQGNLFSGANSTTATTPSIFGSAAPAPATSGLFSGSGTNLSASNMATTSPADNMSIFGQTKAPASLSFGATSPTFGSSNTPSTFSAPNINSGTSTFQIGSPSSSGGLPTFSTIKPTPQFGASTNIPTPANSGTSVFGLTTGTFGSPAAAPPAFGSTPSSSGPTGFGMPNNTGVPNFGSSTTATSPFGTQPTSTTTTSSPFGSAAPATTGPSFSFGGAPQTQQQSQQAPQQPAAAFSFGGATNTNAASSGGLFQFGGSNAPKPAGFNFSAPTSAPAINFSGAAPPAFNAPPANMFSIGSGSSTPRSRTSRQRRQR